MEKGIVVLRDVSGKEIFSNSCSAPYIVEIDVQTTPRKNFLDVKENFVPPAVLKIILE